jgi:hypothetical protein
MVEDSVKPVLANAKTASQTGSLTSAQSFTLSPTTMAATHHESAAKHHREAAKAYDGGKHEQAANHAQVAHGHMAHAATSAAEASKVHADHHDGVTKKS